jgi:plastocyanin
MNLKVVIARLPAVVLAMSLTSAASCSSGGGGGSSNGIPTDPGTASARELNSGDFGPGAVFQHRFFSAGSFGYHCIHHSPMTGSVTVDPNAADSVVNVNIVSFTTPFPAAAVKPGGRVVWTNNTSMVHTVTSN